jgi:hypothetical protein
MRLKDFLDQTREDTLFLKDSEARKKVITVYNKRTSDFESIQEYDAYLLEIEDKIDVLIYGSPQDQANMEQALAQQKRENRMQIEERKRKRDAMLSQMNTI